MLIHFSLTHIHTHMVTMPKIKGNPDDNKRYLTCYNLSLTLIVFLMLSIGDRNPKLYLNLEESLKVHLYLMLIQDHLELLVEH